MTFEQFKQTVLDMYANGARIGWIAQVVAKDGYGTADVKRVIDKAKKEATPAYHCYEHAC